MLRWLFELRYLLGRAPWDTGITPPEVIAFLEQTPAGHALDIGCGTGTNAVEMARRGWRVTGVDFSRRAIGAARRRAAGTGLPVDFRQAEAAELPGIAGPFDFVLDIGCFHSLDAAGQARYAARLANVTKPGSTYMLYTFVDQTGAETGGLPSRRSLVALHAPAFALTRFAIGADRQRPSAWATFVRTG